MYTAPGERLMLKTSEKQAQSLGQVRRESVASGKLTLAAENCQPNKTRHDSCKTIQSVIDVALLPDPATARCPAPACLQLDLRLSRRGLFPAGVS